MTTIQPGTTGRKASSAASIAGKPPKTRELPSIPLSEKLAYSINEFCALHSISRAFYYALQRRGLGPQEMDLDGKKTISREASAAWRAARANASQAEVA